MRNCSVTEHDSLGKSWNELLILAAGDELEGVSWVERLIIQDLGILTGIA